MKSVHNYLLLLRSGNLIILAISQWMCYHYISSANPGQSQLPTFYMFLLVVSTVAAAAFGNVVNDFYDRENDALDKPYKTERIAEIGLKNIRISYIICLIVATCSAAIFDWLISTFWLTIVQFFILPLLFLYSRYFKRWLLIGNVLIASLCAFSLASVLFAFDVYTKSESGTGKIYWFYVGFAFLVTLFREIVKDIEDVEGDRKVGCKTIPIVLGTKTAVWIASIPLFTAVFISIALLSLPETAMTAMVLFVGMLAVLYRLFRAKSKSEFHSVSQITKWMMLPALMLLL